MGRAFRIVGALRVPLVAVVILSLAAAGCTSRYRYSDDRYGQRYSAYDDHEDLSEGERRLRLYLAAATLGVFVLILLVGAGIAALADDKPKEIEEVPPPDDALELRAPVSGLLVPEVPPRKY